MLRTVPTFVRGTGVLAGGVDSPVRAGKRVGGEPFVQARGQGAYAFDESGTRYIDYLMAYGPLLFGHAHPAFSHGLDAIAAGGVCFGSTHENEVRLAERVRAHLPSMERLRFTTTGTEAMMSAIRLARGFTRRDVVIRFAGNYHGHTDTALLHAGASADTSDLRASGIPSGVARDVAICTYNDLAGVDAVLRERGAQVAAIALEPIVGNMGLVLPAPGFIDGLFERARAIGALVIFDEIITWLRLGCAGAQGRLGFTPDLTAIGKIFGGGFPIAAFGGRADVMAALAPEGAVFQGGTHAGNPFATAIAHRVLDLLEEGPELLGAMELRAQMLAAGIERALARLDLGYSVLTLESIVDFKFRSGPPTRNYDDAQAADARAYAAFYHAMRARGILLAPSQNEVMFLCSEHSDADIAETIDAIGASLGELRESGLI